MYSMFWRREQVCGMQCRRDLSPERRNVHRNQERFQDIFLQVDLHELETRVREVFFHGRSNEAIDVLLWMKCR